MKRTRLRRGLVLLLSVTLGIGIACAFVALMMPHRPAQGGQGGRPIARTHEEDRILFEACVILYATVYGTARPLYRMLGSASDSEDVREVASQHLPFLNLCASLWLVACNLDPIRRGVARPLDWAVLVVAGIWVTICFCKVFLALRRYQPFGWTFGAGELRYAHARTSGLAPHSIRHRDEGP